MPTFYSIVSVTDGLRRESDFVNCDEGFELKAYVQKVQIGELNMTWLVSWFSHEYVE